MEKEPEIGERVLIKQEKTKTKPPWNPDPYTIVKVKGSQITATRGKEKKVRNLKKFKLLKERPAELRTKGAEKEVREEDSDWDFNLKPREVMEEEAGSTGESSFFEADFMITYGSDQGEEQ